MSSLQLNSLRSMKCLPVWALLVGTCLTSTPVIAADTAANSPVAVQKNTEAKKGEVQLEEIVVTGSILRRTNKETPSPVTVLSAATLAKAGITTVADAIRSISADNSGTIPTAFANGFAAGASGVALRGLTVNSTLVVIDGLRTANYALADDGQRAFVDLNTIPDSLIERVEILRDGASSTYGADAIGGVVNIITKHTFKGLEGSLEGGTSQHGGGGVYRFDFTGGTGDLETKGYNAYINVEYQHDSVIYNRKRPFPFNTTDLSSLGGQNNNAGIPGQGGSVYAIVQPGTLTDPNNILTGVANTTDPAGMVNAPFQILNPKGCGANSITKNNGTDSYCEQNFTSLYGSIQPKQDRFGVTAKFTAKLGDATEAYLTASYYQNKIVLGTGPAGIRTSTPINTNNIALPVLLSNGQLNPNNPFAADGNVALIQYAFGDIPSSSTISNHVLRAVGGIKGSVAGWTYTADITAVHTYLDSTNRGSLNIAGLFNAIQTGSYNFVDPSTNSAAVRQAIAPDLVKQSSTDLDLIQISGQRSLTELPGGPLQLGIGAALRYERTFDPDNNPGKGTLGLGQAQTIGRHTVASTYFEFGVPIIKQIEANISGRFDHYSEGFNNFSPKVGFKVTPIKQLALRGTYSRGFRAPSFSESGNSGNSGFISYSPPAAFAAAHNGDAYVQSYQLAQTAVANPKIKPELSESFTLGFVAQPLSWLNFTVDYYNIKKKQVISGGDANTALSAYYAGLPLPAGYSIVLDNPDPSAPTAQLRPVEIKSPYFNAASLKTSGLDVDVTVHFNLTDNLKWSSDLDVTNIFKFSFTPLGGDTQNYVGTQGPYILSSGAGTPRIRSHWSNSFDYGPFNLTGTAYYTSGYTIKAADIGPDCLSTDANGNPFPANCKTGRTINVDLTGRYKINDNFDVFFNVLNVFDAKPQFDPANYAATNYNPTYGQSGIVGRFFKLGVSARF